jgi:hypothetical protein
MNVDTGITQLATANGRGEYVLSDVPVGTYTLTVQAPNFRKFEVNSLSVSADQNVQLNAKLTLGMAEAVVTVTAGEATVDTRTATIGTVIDNNLVQGLPVEGNNVVDMAAMLPGVTNVNAPTTFTDDTGGPTYNISGSKATSNLMLLDGIMWNNLFYNTGLNYPPREALQEVSVQLDNYQAEYGRNSGSIFNVVTRSGSNEFHGTLWEYIENHALDAKDYISGQNPHLVQNQFGATVGGPIMRDKAFFFLAWQDLRLAGQLTAQAQTPTLMERGLSAPGVALPCTPGGAFTGTCASFAEDFPGDPGTPAINKDLDNPLKTAAYAAYTLQELNAAWAQQGGTGTSPCVTALQSAAMVYGNFLPNAELPSVCINPVSQNFLTKYIPVPNQQIGSTGTLPFLVSDANQPHNDQLGLARVDWHFAQHSIDARFYVTNANDVTANSATTAANQPGVANYQQDHNVGGIYSGNIGDTMTLTPRMLNVLRLGYKRYTYRVTPLDSTTLSDLGANFSQVGTPSLPEIKVNPRFSVGNAGSAASYSVNEDVEVDDNLNWTHGNHDFQFGAQFLGLQYLQRKDTEPSFTFNAAYTGVSTADFLMGLLYSESVGNTSNVAAVQHDLYLYAEDIWRLTPRLTLSYGIRYELPFQWYSPDNQGISFIPGYQSTVFPTAPANLVFNGDAGLPRSLLAATRYDHFAPRVGFVYDLSKKGTTVFRGGFGIFYDALNASLVGNGAPYVFQATYATPMGGISQPLLGQAPIPQNFQKNNPQFVQPYSVDFADKNMTTPYVEAVNLGIQHQFGGKQSLEVDYVGKFGRHQPMLFDDNPDIYDCSGAYFVSNPTLYCSGASGGATSDAARATYQGFGYGGEGIVDYSTIGTSNYNGLQAIYIQRIKSGITVTASYAYSRSLDELSNTQTTANKNPIPFGRDLRYQYGPSDFNATHVFNMGWVWKLPRVNTGYAMVNAVLSDWQLGGIYNARSGQPINITESGDAALTDEPAQRMNINPGTVATLPSNRHRADKVREWFNAGTVSNPEGICYAPGSTTVLATGFTPGCVLEFPATGTEGNISRNSLLGPAYINNNISVARNFQLQHGMTFQIRADAFNAFNTPNLANPQSGYTRSTVKTGASTFGEILATVGSNGNIGTNGRHIQLSAILHY